MAALKVNADYLKEIENARRHLRALISSRNCAPLMLRLAWVDAGSYDAKTRTGGPNGSIRNKLQGHQHGANNALQIAIDFCEEVKAKHPQVTYADLYQLAGVVAVEVTGGPTIDFVPGRKDSMKSSKEEWHPDAKQGASHLREIFYRVGLSDKDIVTLYGGYQLGRDILSLSRGYTLGRAQKDRSDYKGPWTKDPLKFDNSYFVELLKGELEGLLILPTDKALVEDTKFRQYVELYAKDEDTFFRDYAALHKKLSELGFTPTSWASKLGAKFSTILAQAAVPVTVTAALLILSYFYEVHERT